MQAPKSRVGAVTRIGVLACPPFSAGTGPQSVESSDDAHMKGASRTATILFTDVVGSTSLMARLGPDDSEAVRTRHFATVRSALAVHRGEEVKNLGDGFMAVFESVNDALACAITLQRSTARDDHSLGRIGLSIRIGLSAGEVASEQGDYFGMPVVEANRLCAAAERDQILCTEIVRLLVGSGSLHKLESVGSLELKGFSEAQPAHELIWDAAGESSLRVVIAEDSRLLREGIVKVLESEGFEVVLQTDDAETVLERLSSLRPHVVILDVRMPPTHTTEGLDATRVIRAEYPEIGVIVLSAELQTQAARRLLEGGTEGIGYLLKDRVGDVHQIATAIRTVASGGSAIDPEVAARLATT